VPENAAKLARTLRAMEELLAVVGADSLALDMSIGAAAEQASVQGMASTSTRRQDKSNRQYRPSA
jgi:hypothetical protein